LEHVEDGGRALAVEHELGGDAIMQLHASFF
jgi:hypothetical protein